MQSNGKGGVRKNALSIPGETMTVPEETLRAESAEQFLTSIMQNSEIDLRLRHDAAVKLLSLQKRKVRRETQRTETKKAAETAVTGRFAPMPPPKPKIH